MAGCDCLARARRIHPRSDTGRCGQHELHPANSHGAPERRPEARASVGREIPSYPGTANRTLLETAFYETVRPHPAVRRRMPELLGFDADARILMLEDCGPAGDWTRIYRGAALDTRTCDVLVDYLCALHRIEPATDERRRCRNLEMRRLNHERMFSLPLQPANGLDLDAITPGLSSAAQRLSNDREFVWRVTELGRLYLEEEDGVLLHGDFSREAGWTLPTVFGSSTRSVRSSGRRNSTSASCSRISSWPVSAPA